MISQKRTKLHSFSDELCCTFFLQVMEEGMKKAGKVKILPTFPPPHTWLITACQIVCFRNLRVQYASNKSHFSLDGETVLKSMSILRWVNLWTYLFLSTSGLHPNENRILKVRCCSVEPRSHTVQEYRGVKLVSDNVCSSLRECMN